MSTANNTKGWTPPDLLLAGTTVWTSYDGHDWQTTWATDSSHSDGMVFGMDGEPISPSGWCKQTRKSIKPDYNRTPGGKADCYIWRDKKKENLLKLCEQYSAPPAVAVAAAGPEPPAVAVSVKPVIAPAPESVSLVVEEAPDAMEIAALKAEIVKLKAALKCFI